MLSKDQALSLPPHRAHYCAIDFLPGATLPSSRLYNITHPEREAMKAYITDSLASGLIRLLIAYHLVCIWEEDEW